MFVLCFLHYHIISVHCPGLWRFSPSAGVHHSPLKLKTKDKTDAHVGNPSIELFVHFTAFQPVTKHLTLIQSGKRDYLQCRLVCFGPAGVALVCPLKTQSRSVVLREASLPPSRNTQLHKTTTSTMTLLLLKSPPAQIKITEKPPTKP